MQNTNNIRIALAQFATGVTVVTAESNGIHHGMTCNSFAPVSLEPPLVLWSIRNTSSSHEFFTQSSGYTINVLSRVQQAIATQFASGEQADRFHNIPFETTASSGHQRRRLLGTLAWFDCELVESIACGDHAILIGRVLSFGKNTGTGDENPVDTLPLVYANRQFGTFQA